MTFMLVAVMVGRPSQINVTLLPYSESLDFVQVSVLPPT